MLDQLLAAAVEREIITASPAEGVRLPRIVRSEARFLTAAELERLSLTIDPRFRAMVLLMAWATLRLGEASGLRRSDVDLLAGTIRIENNAVQVRGHLIEGPPKTRAGRRTMTLPPSLVDDLAAHLETQPGSRYVFGASGERPIAADDWRRRHWRPAVVAAGLEPLRPHDLKHTSVALLATCRGRSIGDRAPGWAHFGRVHLRPLRASLPGDRQARCGEARPGSSECAR